MKLLIFGASGMLGFTLHRVLHDAGYDVVGTLRTDRPPDSAWCTGLHYAARVDVADFHSVAASIEGSGADVAINAAGITASAGADARQVLAVNAVFPRLVDTHAAALGLRQFIHFSTDGVFRGASGGYDEEALPDADDLYGMSKYLGEPSGPHSLVLRTSLIGRAPVSGSSLLDWFLRQRGVVRGYGRAMFSGLPVNEIARLFAERILPRREPLVGLFHLSAAPVSKAALLEHLRVAWRRADVSIELDDTVALDRTLDSSRLRKLLDYSPPDWPQLAAGLHSFYGRLDAGTHAA